MTTTAIENGATEYSADLARPVATMTEVGAKVRVDRSNGFAEYPDARIAAALEPEYEWLWIDEEHGTTPTFGPGVIAVAFERWPVEMMTHCGGEKE